MDNDETIMNEGDAPKQPQQQPQLNKEQPAAEQNKEQPAAEQAEGKEKSSKRKRRVGMTVAEGIAAAGLVVGRIAPVQLFPSPSDIDGGLLSDDDLLADADAEADTASELDHASLEGHDLEVATGVDDSMSFSEAFLAAREETGPGGLFVWHGHSYGTYYANEWESMSDEDKEQYLADVTHTSDTISDELEELEDLDLADAEPIEMIDGLEPISVDAIETDDEVADIIVPDDLEVEVATDLADAGEALEEIEVIPELDSIAPGALENGEELADIIVPDDLEVEVATDLLTPDDPMADLMDGVNATEAHLDIDPSGMLAIDPDIPMDNDMDMDEFV